MEEHEEEEREWIRDFLKGDEEDKANLERGEAHRPRKLESARSTRLSRTARKIIDSHYLSRFQGRLLHDVEGEAAKHDVRREQFIKYVLLTVTPRCDSSFLCPENPT